MDQVERMRRLRTFRELDQQRSPETLLQKMFRSAQSRSVRIGIFNT
jgi:hypothetical protein